MIPTESLDKCKEIRKEIMKGGKPNKFLKGSNVYPACASNAKSLGVISYLHVE